MSYNIAHMQFSAGEIKDLLVAWLALGVAFALFFGGGSRVIRTGEFPSMVAVSLLTAGVGFLLHELAHKVVAVHFGQVAEFRADYGMLFLAIVSALAGFIFAAPGAVVHSGHRITKRENGLIALAGPVTNLGLAVVFVLVWFVPLDIAARIGFYGVLINVFLAAFNMIPFGPLDGRKVVSWSKVIWLVTFAVSGGLTAVLLLGVLG